MFGKKRKEEWPIDFFPATRRKRGKKDSQHIFPSRKEKEGRRATAPGIEEREKSG